MLKRKMAYRTRKQEKKKNCDFTQGGKKKARKKIVISQE